MQRCRDEFADATYSADLMKPDAGWDGPPLVARMGTALTDEALPRTVKDILLAANSTTSRKRRPWTHSLLLETPARLIWLFAGELLCSSKGYTAQGDFHRG